MDFEKIFGDMLNAMKLSLGENATEAFRMLKKCTEKNKEAIREATTLLESGDISVEEFKSIMNDNALVFESEIQNLSIVKKKAVKEALTAGANIIELAVKTL